MTIDELYKKLDDDLSWRKTKISRLYSMLDHDKNNVTLLESIILMLYAHWEGYIKNIAKLYLQYVSNKKITHNNLLDNFICISTKTLVKYILPSSETLSIENELKFCNHFKTKQGSNFHFDIKKSGSIDKSIINTKDNLNYKVYKNILTVIGVNCYEGFELREQYINKFLHTRNSISHGDKIHPSNSKVIELSITTVTDIKNFILEIMSTTQDTIKEYAQSEFYLNKNLQNKESYDTKNNKAIAKFIESTNDL